MELVVHGPEARLQHVRVYLCRRQIGMSKHHLDGPEIGAAIEEVRRERMPQHVRTKVS